MVVQTGSNRSSCPRRTRAQSRPMKSFFQARSMICRWPASWAMKAICTKTNARKTASRTRSHGLATISSQTTPRQSRPRMSSSIQA